MNAGKLIVGAIVIVSAIAGGFLWYTAERAYYTPVAFQPGAEIRLVPLTSDQPEAIIVNGIEGIDADSSPLKFRACFITPMTVAMLTESYRIYEKPTPLFAPRWFSCFDAQAIGEDLETGKAVAILSDENIKPGVDRVVAVYPDGRAYAWQQLNASADNQQGSAP